LKKTGGFSTPTTSGGSFLINCSLMIFQSKFNFKRINICLIFLLTLNFRNEPLFAAVRIPVWHIHLRLHNVWYSVLYGL
jgi:hypothetical protein